MNQSAINQDILIDRARNGDQDALDILLRDHRQLAFKYALHWTHDLDDAADIVSETLIRVQRGITSYSGQGSFSTWLHRITSNCFLTMKRKERMRKETSLNVLKVEDDGESELRIEDKGLSPFDVAATNDELQTLLRAFRRLPRHQEELLRTHFLEMRSYRETARLLGIPIGTVKSSIFRARCKLARLTLH
ncbi:MAG: RNA polymerase sigma factor [Armatimonadetes bacterium]|nr:RNA polymerase sigma factor [Armatimonadota bacterium]